jgi:hypothetical protein
VLVARPEEKKDLELKKKKDNWEKVLYWDNCLCVTIYLYDLYCLLTLCYL